MMGRVQEPSWCEEPSHVAGRDVLELFEPSQSICEWRLVVGELYRVIMNPQSPPWVTYLSYPRAIITLWQASAY